MNEINKSVQEEISETIKQFEMMSDAIYEIVSQLYEDEYHATAGSPEILTWSYKDSIMTSLVKVSDVIHYCVRIDVDTLNITVDHMVKYKTTDCT